MTNSGAFNFLVEPHTADKHAARKDIKDDQETAQDGKLYNAYGLTMDPTNCARACIGRGNQPMRRARCLAGSRTFCATLFTKGLCEKLKCAPKQRMSSTHFNCSPSTCNCLASDLACNEVPQHLLFQAFKRCPVKRS